MFKAISMLFTTCFTLLSAVNIFASTGEDYAKQFKLESEHGIAVRKAKLAQQVELDQV